jgi:hypothetical protein
MHYRKPNFGATTEEGGTMLMEPAAGNAPRHMLARNAWDWSPLPGATPGPPTWGTCPRSPGVPRGTSYFILPVLYDVMTSNHDVSATGSTTSVSLEHSVAHAANCRV